MAAIFVAAIQELTGDDYSEDQQEAWMAVAEDEEFGRRLAADLTLIATLDGSPVGFASLRGQRSHSHALCTSGRGQAGRCHDAG